jgi:hypothetical protein
LDTKPVYQGNQFGKENRKVFRVTKTKGLDWQMENRNYFLHK